jgi:hypothetical protein
VRWKEVARNLAEMHGRMGVSRVVLRPDRLTVDRTEMVNTCSDDDLLVVRGNVLSPKSVRTWLWQKRKWRSLKRRNAVIWSVYDSDENQSVVGTGALVSKPVAERYEGLKNG